MSTIFPNFELVFAFCSHVSNVVAYCNLFKMEDNFPIQIELFI